MKYWMMILLSSMLLVTGCVMQSPNPTASQPPGIAVYVIGNLNVPAMVSKSSATFQVIIQDQQFFPLDLEIGSGDSVEWVNLDNRTHTLSFADGGLEVVVPRGGSAGHTFSEQGQFPYFSWAGRRTLGNVFVR